MVHTKLLKRGRFRNIPAAFLEHFWYFFNPFWVDQEFARSQGVKSGVNMHGMCVIDFYLVNSIVITQVPLQPLDAKTIAATALRYENIPAAFDRICSIKEGFKFGENRSHGLAFFWRYETLFVGFIA